MQHQIEQHQIDGADLQDVAHGRAVRGVAYLEPFLDEVTSQHGPDPRFVVHDQDMHRVAHLRSVRAIANPIGSGLTHIVTFRLKAMLDATPFGINR